MSEAWRETLTRAQKRRLSRFECGWCNMPLNRLACGAIHDRCGEDNIRDRARRCLQASPKAEIRDTKF